MTKSRHATYKRRLLLLANFLHKLPPRRFDYNIWVGHDWKGGPKLDCGTTACALGWATTIPQFRRLGLKMVRTNIYPDGVPAINKDGFRARFLPPESPKMAAQSIFGLTEREYSHLFIPVTYREMASGPKQVAKRIKKFVKTWELPSELDI